MASHNELVTPTRFWDLNSIDEWPMAENLDRMLHDNEVTLDYLRTARRDSGAPPLPEKRTGR